MKVELLHHTPLWVASSAIRTCWASEENSDTTDEMKQSYEIIEEYDDDSGCLNTYVYDNTNECGEKDKELIDRVGNKFKHASTLEHISYNFHISGVSRALLQEIVRHRISSFSVKSSRYTLKELKTEESFYCFSPSVPNFTGDEWQRAEKYLVMAGIKEVDLCSIMALENLRVLIAMGISNDYAKYAMPDAYKTEIAWTINLRSLQNFLSLRSNKSALWEIRKLAHAVYAEIPEEHKCLLKDCVMVYATD